MLSPLSLLDDVTLTSLLHIRLPSTFSLSFVLLALIFHILAPRYHTLKQTSWILTTFSSAFMSLASLPFLYDYVIHGGSVVHIRAFPRLELVASRFFQAYLAADLSLGIVYYRSQISPLTGWLHHVLYVMIVEFAPRRTWARIFCLCTVMEISTFILGITTLYPHLRSNILFACAFFATRILLHIILIISYFLEHNRLATTGSSYVPSIILASVFPVHAMWFYGYVQGFKRRRSLQKKKDERRRNVPPVISLDIYPAVQPRESNCKVPPRPPLTYVPRGWVKIGRPGSLSHIPTADFLGMERGYKKDVSGFITSSDVPLREAVFDFVGLGKGNKQTCRVA